MAQENPSNPNTQDPNHTSKDVQMPIAKARVLDAHGMPNENGFHSIRIRVYADNAPYIAPVLSPMPGSVWVPPEGSDVAVLFDQSDKPWVIGSWYALDRVEDGTVDLPDYEPGDIRLGNPSGSHVTVKNDGVIKVATDSTKRVDIDHHSASVSLEGENQTIASGNTDIIEFDTVEENPEGIWDQSTYQMVAKANGLHRFTASVALPNPGQNNDYTISIYVNGTEQKRITRQSAVNEELGIQVATMERLDIGDAIDIRVTNGSGQSRDILANDATTEFDFRRAGI